MKEKGVWRTVRGRRVYIVDGQFYFGGPAEYNHRMAEGFEYQFVRNDDGKIVKQRANTLTKTDEEDIMDSVKVGDTDGYSTVIAVDQISLNEIEKEISDFSRNYGYADHEFSEIITSDGRKFLIEGTAGSVNSEIVGENNLRGSTVIHNHPVWEGYDFGDSFSKNDFVFAAKNKTSCDYLVSGEEIHKMMIIKPFSEEKAYDLYMVAQRHACETFFDSNTSMDFVQYETMKVLSKITEGVVFYEVKGRTV